MEEYIDREIAIKEAASFIRSNDADWIPDALKRIPAAEVVSKAAYLQVAWERDVAIGQLEDIGKGFGETMDNVAKINRGKWILDSGRWTCSECRKYATYTRTGLQRLTNFCPDCGAIMKDK